MALILKNTTGSNITYSSILTTVPANGSSTVDPSNYYIICRDPYLLSDVSQGNIVLNDGAADYAPENTTRFIDYLLGTLQRDTDGASIIRNKAAKSGWTYAALPIEITTSNISGVFTSLLNDGTTSRTEFTVKAYNGSGTEVTTPGLLNANLATITQTVIDFEPSYDYEIIGGELRTESSISTDMRLWIIAVPDIPAGSGGSKEMAGGINLRYLTPGNVYSVDGRVTKYLKYDAVYHTNKLRIILRYPAGTTEQLSVVFEIYRQ